MGERKPRLPKDMPYGYLPFGLTWIIMALGIFVSVTSETASVAEIGRIVARVGLFGGLIAFLLFMAMKPNFIKPKWLLWLESNYDRATINFMFAQARLDPENWESQVFTQKGLEDWAEEVAWQYKKITLQRELQLFKPESPSYKAIEQKLAEMESESAD